MNNNNNNNNPYNNTNQNYPYNNPNQNYQYNNNPYNNPNQNYQYNNNPYNNPNQNYQYNNNPYNNINPDFNNNTNIRKPSFSALHITLIVIIIVLAVVIFALSAVISALKKDDNPKNSGNNNLISVGDSENISESEDTEEDYTEEEETEPETETFTGELAVPLLGEFDGKPTEDGNGVILRLDWNAVENADGYEIEAIETEDNSGEPYERKIITSDTYFETGSSVAVKIKTRVRAYNGDEDNRVYGEWSEPVECNLKDFVKTKKIKVSSTPVPVYYVTINNYKLQMYNSPDYEFFAYDYITDRGTYTMTERKGRWGKLQSGKWINLDDADKQGWISIRGTKAYVSTKKDPLTIRYAPTKSSKAIGYIPKDESINVHNIDIDGWYYVTYDGISGFISGEYVSFGTPDKFEAYTMEINNYNLPVYKKADKSSDIIKYINDRDTYTIVEHDSSDKWGKLKNNGWINLKDARTFGKKGSGETAYVSTTTEPLTLRYGPDTSAKKVTSIDKGESITVHNIDLNDWYYVEYKNKNGFVSAKYVTLGEPEKTETTTETTETTETTTKSTTTATTTEITETEQHTEYTEPVTEPPYIETQPPVIETDPPETIPPVIETAPPVIETDPPIEIPDSFDDTEIFDSYDY
ncbi:MAG: SH3 domain-containing protein [Ruminococcus sp.]|nr:SH3 domain-containing protein [Ruminococcus sp.]